MATILVKGSFKRISDEGNLMASLDRMSGWLSLMSMTLTITVTKVLNWDLEKRRKRQKLINNARMSGLVVIPLTQWYMRVRKVKIKVFKKLLFDGVST